ICCAPRCEVETPHPPLHRKSDGRTSAARECAVRRRPRDESFMEARAPQRPQSSQSMSVRVSRSAAESSPAQLRAADPVTIVIFGASGDLAQRKLIPALYQLQRGGYLPERYAVVGFSRTPMSDEQYREAMRNVLRERVGDGAGVPSDDPLVQALHYQPGDAGNTQAFEALKAKVEAVERARQLPGNRIFYLPVAPGFFAQIITRLAAAGLIQPPTAPAWSRVIIEKPFGHDLESARELTAKIREVLDESQIYRI